jgi:ribosomal protein S18 acetylase RimI-like enzyme
MSPHLSIVPAGARAGLLDLLLLADGSEQQVNAYVDRGDLYVYSIEGAAVGVILAIALADAVELKAVAVHTSHQSRGIGTRMLADVLADLRSKGCKRAIVGTASSGTEQLAYYQKAGFRFHVVERDFFTAARGYPHQLIENGIWVRDMVWMDMTLEP